MMARLYVAYNDHTGPMPVRCLLRRAFTLLEVLLVIAVLVVLAALVAPNIAGRREQAQLEYIASHVSSLLSLARSTAMTTGRRHRCVFDENGSRMWIEHEVDPIEQGGQFEPINANWARFDLAEQDGRCVMVDLSGLHKLIRAKEIELLDQDLPEDVYDPVEFRPDGRCDGGMIVLAGPSGRQTALELDGLTGQVRISDKWQGDQELE